MGRIVLHFQSTRKLRELCSAHCRAGIKVVGIFCEYPPRYILGRLNLLWGSRIVFWELGVWVSSNLQSGDPGWFYRLQKENLKHRAVLEVLFQCILVGRLKLKRKWAWYGVMCPKLIQKARAWL